MTVYAGESCNVVASFYNGDTAIAKASLATVVCWLYNKATGLTINSRTNQSILDVNGGTITAAGVLTLRLEAADNVIVVAGSVADTIENHVLRVKWTWNDGVAVRTGIDHINLDIHQVQTVAAPP